MANIEKGKKRISFLIIQCESCGAEHEVKVEALKEDDRYSFKCSCCSHTNQFKREEIS